MASPELFVITDFDCILFQTANLNAWWARRPLLTSPSASIASSTISANAPLKIRWQTCYFDTGITFIPSALSSAFWLVTIKYSQSRLMLSLVNVIAFRYPIYFSLLYKNIRLLLSFGKCYFFWSGHKVITYINLVYIYFIQMHIIF